MRSDNVKGWFAWPVRDNLAYDKHIIYDKHHFAMHSYLITIQDDCVTTNEILPNLTVGNVCKEKNMLTYYEGKW